MWNLQPIFTIHRFNVVDWCDDLNEREIKCWCDVRNLMLPSTAYNMCQSIKVFDVSTWFPSTIAQNYQTCRMGFVATPRSAFQNLKRNRILTTRVGREIDFIMHIHRQLSHPTLEVPSIKQLAECGIECKISDEFIRAYLVKEMTPIECCCRHDRCDF